MKKLIFLCILAAIGYFGYNKYFKQYLGPSEAAVAYTRFADALAYYRFDEAKSLARDQGLSTVKAEERKLTRNLSPFKIGAGAMAAANEARKEAGLGALKDKSVVTGAQLMEELAGPVVGTKFEVVTEKVSGNSSRLEVKGNICRKQPGCMGTRCTSCLKSLHTVEMCKNTDSWQVCSYEIAEVPLKE